MRMLLHKIALNGTMLALGILAPLMAGLTFKSFRIPLTTASPGILFWDPTATCGSQSQKLTLARSAASMPGEILRNSLFRLDSRNPQILSRDPMMHYGLRLLQAFLIFSLGG